MYSYWEKQSFLSGYDYAIIGAGIVGLQAALALHKARPKAAIAVLERGALPLGASSKNAGFACIGSLSELIDDRQYLGEDALWQLVERRYEGLQLLRQSLGDANIGYIGQGNYEVFDEREQKNYQDCLDRLEWANTALQKITGLDSCFRQVEARQDLAPFPYLIQNRAEGAIDTGKMMRSLLKKVQEAGITCFYGIEISRIEEHPERQTLYDAQGAVFLQVPKLLIATNAFAKDLIEELELVPARNQVLITKPLQKLPFRGVYHYLQGYIYFRDIGQRILLGGARHIDKRAEETAQFELSPPIQNYLREFLQRLAPEAEIDYSWAGIMGLDPKGKKEPILQKRPSGTVLALRLGGMGVALGSLLGQEAAALVLED